jgi:hypothetical protein
MPLSPQLRRFADVQHAEITRLLHNSISGNAIFFSPINHPSLCCCITINREQFAGFSVIPTAEPLPAITRQLQVSL